MQLEEIRGAEQRTILFRFLSSCLHTHVQSIPLVRVPLQQPAMRSSPFSVASSVSKVHHLGSSSHIHITSIPMSTVRNRPTMAGEEGGMNLEG